MDLVLGPRAVHDALHDLARSPLRSTPWLHRRIDVDYNGWWMCLIPTAVIREIGLSLPLFIKWDDAEFGLRAGEAGFPTVSLPGAAVWHVPWTEKDDTIDWQAYFHERNRLISALLHSPYDHGGRLVLESLTNHVKRLVSMQYGTGEIIMLALQDVLDGPERMHRDMGTRLPRLREMREELRRRSQQPRARPVPEAPHEEAAAPWQGHREPDQAAGQGEDGRHRPGAAVHPAARARPASSRRASSRTSTSGGSGWRTTTRPSCRRPTGPPPRGTAATDGSSWTRCAATSELHARLYREWPELSARYKDALAQLTSPEVWKASFEGFDDD